MALILYLVRGIENITRKRDGKYKKEGRVKSLGDENGIDKKGDFLSRYSVKEKENRGKKVYN